MFAKHSTIGWESQGAQTAVALAALAVVMSPMYLFGLNPIIFTLLMAPLVFGLAFAKPIAVCVLFILFSTFRIHDAYPVLIELRLPLILGGAALMGMMAKLFSTPAAGQSWFREIKILAIIFALGTIALGVVASAFGQSIGSGVGRIVIMTLAGFAILTTITWFVFVQKTSDHPLPRELMAFAVFFCIVTFGLIFSHLPPISIGFWGSTYWKIAAMTLAIAWLARDESDFQLIMTGLMAAGAAIACVAIYNGIYGISLVEGTRVAIGRERAALGQPMSSLGDPNDLALILLFPLSFALSTILHRAPKLPALLAAVVAVLILVGIVFTQSRGGLLGILAVFGVFGLMVVKNKLLVIAAGAAVAPALFIVMGIADRASGGAAELQHGLDASSSIRLLAWQAGFNMAVANPLTGVGLDAFALRFYAFTPEWPGKNYAAHSTWFGVMGVAGFAGFAAFVTMMYFAIKSAFQSREALIAAKDTSSLRISSDAILAGFAGFCVSGTFLSQGFTWPIYIFVALTAALARVLLTSGIRRAAAPEDNAPEKTKNRARRWS